MSGVKFRVVTLLGDFDRVREVEATSLGGHLSLESVERDGAVAIFKRPFGQANNVSIFSSPNKITLGVLDDDRVSIEGETATSILYREAADIAMMDLHFRMDHQTVTVPVNGAGIQSNDAVSVVDGHIALNGDYQQPAAIEVLSNGDHLSLDHLDVPGGGAINLTAPFSSIAVVVSNTPNSVVLGVLGSDNRIDISGQTLTSVLYHGPADEFYTDVIIHLGLGDSPPIALPEPSSGLLALGVLLGLVLRRRSASA